VEWWKKTEGDVQVLSLAGGALERAEPSQKKKLRRKEGVPGIEQKTTQCLSGLGLSGARATLVHLTIPTPEPLGCDGGWDVR
jgi:hypothetical protein